jgi:hypothetical protein
MIPDRNDEDPSNYWMEKIHDPTAIPFGMDLGIPFR